MTELINVSSMSIPIIIYLFFPNNFFFLSDNILLMLLAEKNENDQVY